MSYCKNCEIEYKTNLDKCLICGDNLNNEVELKFNYQPYVKESMFKKYFLKAFMLLNILSIIITISIDYVYDQTLYFSLIVSLCNLYFILFLTIIFSHHSFERKVFNSVFLSSILVILIGIIIKNYHWAIDLVLPFLFISNTLMLTIITFVKRKTWQDYAPPLMLSILANILVILLNFFNISVVKWPILVSFFYGLSTLLGLMIFTPKDIKEEFIRRLHI